ncbi:MAG: hypothetical protein LBG04_03320, partial [Holosporaceae bacterium]|nr:hypothetical protein [Holosporaceae bacterium]
MEIFVFMRTLKLRFSFTGIKIILPEMATNLVSENILMFPSTWSIHPPLMPIIMVGAIDFSLMKFSDFS